MAANREKTYYEVLGVSPEATQDEIREAYLKLARKYHPDRTGGDPAAEARLKEINNAYDTLKKPEKREEYDRMLRGPSPEDFARAARARAQSGGGHGADFDFGFDFGGANPFAEFFRDFGGAAGPQGGRGRRAPMPGNDIEVSLPITLREVATGGRKTLRVPHRGVCPTCQGSGAAPGTQPEICSECQGSGRVTRDVASGFTVYQTCPACRGTGRIVSKPCPTCRGAGETLESRTISVTIPAGAYTGMRLRLAGQGDAGEPGAPPGDLYVILEVQPDPVFERDRNNVICEVPVPFTTAILGGTVRVPTLRGEANLKIPAGTQSGRTFRMRAQGLPDVHNGHIGDQLVRVRIQVPTRLSDEAIDLVQRLRDTIEPSAYGK